MRISTHALIRRGHKNLTDVEGGATAVEYCIIVAAIASVVIATAFTVGQKLLPGLEAVIALWP